MCEFASFVLTKDREFYLPNTDSHSEIIRHFGLHDYSSVTGCHIMKVEITPNRNMTTWPSLADWNYCVDSDMWPDWHNDDPSATDLRTRAALYRRAKTGFSTVNLNGVNKLRSISLPRTQRLSIRDALKLVSIAAPRVKELVVTGAPLLASVTAPEVKKLCINDSKRLKKIIAPKAINAVNLERNYNLEYVSVRSADVVCLKGCKNLKKLIAPRATKVYLGRNSTAVVKTKKGAKIYRGNNLQIFK
jgi:hypothetical protein